MYIVTHAAIYVEPGERYVLNTLGGHWRVMTSANTCPVMTGEHIKAFPRVGDEWAYSTALGKPIFAKVTRIIERDAYSQCDALAVAVCGGNSVMVNSVMVLQAMSSWTLVSRAPKMRIEAEPSRPKYPTGKNLAPNTFEVVKGTWILKNDGPGTSWRPYLWQHDDWILQCHSIYKPFPRVGDVWTLNVRGAKFRVEMVCYASLCAGTIAEVRGEDGVRIAMNIRDMDYWTPVTLAHDASRGEAAPSAVTSHAAAAPQAFEATLTWTETEEGNSPTEWPAYASKLAEAFGALGRPEVLVEMVMAEAPPEMDRRALRASLVCATDNWTMRVKDAPGPEQIREFLHYICDPGGVGYKHYWYRYYQSVLRELSGPPQMLRRPPYSTRSPNKRSW